MGTPSYEEVTPLLTSPESVLITGVLEDTVLTQGNYSVNNEKRITHGGGTLLGSIFTLMTCAVGSGVLSLPFAFEESGIVLSAIILLAMSAINFYSLHLLVVCSTVSNKHTYQEVASLAYGKFGTTAVEVVILFALFGSMVGFIVIIGDLLSPVACQFTGHYESCSLHTFYFNRNFLSFVIVLFVISPLSFLPKIHQFQFSSALAVLTVLFLLIVVIIRSIQSLVANSFHPPDISLFKFSIIGIGQTIPIMAFALGCHVQVIPVYAQLKQPLYKLFTMDKVIFGANGISTTFYLVVGIFGYLNFGNAVQGNVLSSFSPSDVLATVSRISMAFHISLAFPLLIWPSRNIVDQFFVSKHNQLDTPNAKRSHLIRHVLETLIFLFSAFGLAVVLPNITIVFGFTGAIAGMLANYIFPCVFYLKIVKGNSFWKHRLPAFTLVVVGIITGLTSTAILTLRVIQTVHK